MQAEKRNEVNSKGANLILVPPLGIEPGPTEPESVILSFKLQGHPVLGMQNYTIFPKFLVYL